MHHQLANQELARIRYAESIRNSTRQFAVERGAEAEESRATVVRGRLRIAVGNLFGHVPVTRPTLGHSG